MRDTVLELFDTWLKLLSIYILMVVEIAYAVIVDQFSHLVSFVVTIIMLVSGYIA